MPMRLQPVEIYQYALEAGFSPDQAVTMTAIALAESGGNPNAHNPVGENSIGLWQVNREAHTRFLNADGTDPLTNAQMAYEVSGGGADIGRWTVTHADKGAPYLNHRAQAEAAAAAAGHPEAKGQWNPPENYHSPKASAGPAGDGPPPDLPGGDEAGAPDPAASASAAPDPAVAEAPQPPSLDSDSDGLIDAYEETGGTDPFAADTDRDGFSDSAERLHGTDPLGFGDNPLVGTATAAEPGAAEPGAEAPPLTTEGGPDQGGVGGQTPLPGQPAPVPGPAPQSAPGPPGVVGAAGPAGAAGTAGARGALPAEPGGPVGAGPDALVAEGTELDTFLDAALSQQGATYVYGSEEPSNDPDPLGDGDASYDCSSLIRWAAAQAGVDFTNGSYLQYLDIQQAGTELSVEEALRTPGALVFNFSTEPVPGGGRPSQAHVAISLGDGRLMEARSSKYDVGVFDAEGREFSHAGFIPELGTELAPDSGVVDLEGSVLADPLPVLPESDLLDTDGDGLIDAYERLVGIDPFSGDTDRDGFLDSNELLYGSDPLEFVDNPLVGPAGEVPDIGVPLTTEVPSGQPGAGQDELIDRGLDDDLSDAAGLDSGLQVVADGGVDDDYGAGDFDTDVDGDPGL